MHAGLPAAQGLYDPNNEHDSCAVGFIVNLKGRKSHQIVRDGITALENMSHRGACGCENNTGDGAGLLIQIPHDFLVSRCQQLLDRAAGARQATAWAHSSARVTRRPSGAGRSCSRSWWPRKGKASWDGGGSRPIHHPWERAPGRSSRGCGMPSWAAGRGSTMPRGSSASSTSSASDSRARSRKAGLDDHKYFYFSSLSCRTLVYKGMLTSAQLGHYFADDLGDPLLSSAMCMVHSRFLHQHVSELAACASLPDDLAQRRNQHAAGQHQLDAGPGGALRLGPVRAGRLEEDQADHPRGAFRFGLPRQCRRAAGAVRLQPGARDDDAHSRSLGKQPHDGAGEARLLPLS